MKQKHRVLFWSLGLLLLGLLFYRVGVEDVWTYVQTMGWGYIPVLGISLLWNLSNTWAWAACFGQRGEQRSGFWTLFRTKLGGEAVGQVMPVSVAGEVAKAYMLRAQVSVTRGLPSVVINKTTEFISGLGFVLLGAVVAVRQFSLPVAVQKGLAVGLLLATLGIVAGVLKQRQNAFGWILNLLKRLRLPFLEGRRQKVEEMDRNIAAFYRQNWRGFLISLGLHSLSWVLGTLEVYFILRWLGQPLPFVSAFLLCSLSVIINTAFFFIPSGVGVFEGGHVFLFHLLGLGSGLGLAVGVIRRIRKIFWVLLGFLLLLPGIPRPVDESGAGISEQVEKGPDRA